MLFISPLINNIDREERGGGYHIMFADLNMQTACSVGSQWVPDMMEVLTYGTVSVPKKMYTHCNKVTADAHRDQLRHEATGGHFEELQ